MKILPLGIIYLLIANLTIYSQSINDFEFEIIRTHTKIENLLNFKGEMVECVSNVIFGHHLWYNGEEGYPKDFDNRKSKYKFVIDMVSVADSIDAATDNIGRTYAKTISLEKVISEIQAQAGTRYSPIIADALNDENLLKKIQQCITSGREAAYYEAYMEIYN